MHIHPRASRLVRRSPKARHGLSQPVFLVLLVAVALLAGLGGFAFYHMTEEPVAGTVERAAAQGPRDMHGMQRPEFSLPDLDGHIRHIGEFDGNVVLVNFWATWCPPCLKEMPAFVEVQEGYGDQGMIIVAVAIDDEHAVRDFSNAHGLNFPVLLGESGGMTVTRDYGNRLGTLPYSVLLDREGVIRFVHAGELHKETLERELQPLL